MIMEKETEDTELKELITNFVGNRKSPENREVTIEHIIEIFAEEFPELILKVAEENWINGYTQALNDVEYIQTSRAPVSEDRIDVFENTD